VISTILAVALFAAASTATLNSATGSILVDAKQEAAALATMSEGAGAPVKAGRHVLLETSKGSVVLALFDQDSPETAENFAKLVKKGFYDGTKFHRVIEGFVAQGGDPNGTGEGGPGYEIKFEKNRLKHVTGAVGMARSQELDSAGSQFFIDFQPLPNLDQKYDADGKPTGGYVVFGQVVTGMDVVNKLTRTMGRKSMDPFPGVEADKVVRAKLLD
jgi:peptidyl-prolyl cis-trans isomerase B (cyclophilin B)